MQHSNETTISTPAQTVIAAQPVPTAATVAAITTAEAAKLDTAKAAQRAKREAATSKPAKQAPASTNGKQAAKRVASKPTAEKPAKPTQAAREAAQRDAIDARRLARQCAGAAVSAFYSGKSLPFKAASDRFSDINPSNGKSASTRQAGLLLALITYGAGNLKPDGTFTRGAFVVPAKLINTNAKPGETIRAQPESGCLGNMLGRVCDFVSGPTSGREQSAAVYRLRVKAAIAEIQAAFGDKPAQAAAKLLATYAKRAA